eukprot:COSAG03_NODE_2642_length_2567_cov_2.069287_1_plen_240_part_10
MTVLRALLSIYRRKKIRSFRSAHVNIDRITKSYNDDSRKPAVAERCTPAVGSLGHAAARVAPASAETQQAHAPPQRARLRRMVARAFLRSVPRVATARGVGIEVTGVPRNSRRLVAAARAPGNAIRLGARGLALGIPRRVVVHGWLPIPPVGDRLAHGLPIDADLVPHAVLLARHLRAAGSSGLAARECHAPVAAEEAAVEERAVGRRRLHGQAAGGAATRKREAKREAKRERERERERE